MTDQRLTLNVTSSLSLSTANREKSLEEVLSEHIVKAIELLRAKNIKVAFAESCTGGLLSHKWTEIAGVSDVFWGGIVSYSNESKKVFLDVPDEVFKKHGAVSEPCASAMSLGLLNKIRSQLITEEIKLENFLVASITGVAGPAGGSEFKPVGTVAISVMSVQFAFNNNWNMNVNFEKNYTNSFFQQFNTEQYKAELESLNFSQRKWIQYQSAIQVMKQILEFLEN